MVDGGQVVVNEVIYFGNFYDAVFGGATYRRGLFGGGRIATCPPVYTYVASMHGEKDLCIYYTPLLIC